MFCYVNMYVKYHLHAICTTRSFGAHGISIFSYCHIMLSYNIVNNMIWFIVITSYYLIILLYLIAIYHFIYLTVIVKIYRHVLHTVHKYTLQFSLYVFFLTFWRCFWRISTYSILFYYKYKIFPLNRYKQNISSHEHKFSCLTARDM